MSISLEELTKLALTRKCTVPLVRVIVNGAAAGENRPSQQGNASPVSDDEPPPPRPLRIRTRSRMVRYRSSRIYSVADLVEDVTGVNMETNQENDAVPVKRYGGKRPSSASVPVKPPSKKPTVTVAVTESSGEELPQPKVSDESTDAELPVNDDPTTLDSAEVTQQEVVAVVVTHTLPSDVDESSQELDQSGELFHDASGETSSDSGIHNQSGEREFIEPDPDQPKSDFTIEGFFEYLFPRAAKTKTSSQQLLADILKRDHIFLIVHRHYLEIRGNGYLMKKHSTEELFGQILSRLKGIVEGELAALTSSYHEILGILSS